MIVKWTKKTPYKDILTNFFKYGFNFKKKTKKILKKSTKKNFIYFYLI